MDDISPLPAPSLLPIPAAGPRHEGESFEDYSERLIASLDPLIEAMARPEGEAEPAPAAEPQPQPWPPPDVRIPPHIWQVIMLHFGKEALKAMYAGDPAGTLGWAWAFYRGVLDAQERHG